MILFKRLIIVVFLFFFTNVAMAALEPAIFSFNKQDHILKCTSLCSYNSRSLVFLDMPATYESVVGEKNHLVPFINVKSRKSVPLLSSTGEQVAMLDVDLKYGYSNSLIFQSKQVRDSFINSFSSSCGLTFAYGGENTASMRRAFYTGDGACSATANNDSSTRIPALGIQHSNGYAVSIFNPDIFKDLPPGQYTSELILSIGAPPADIDLGMGFSDRDNLIIPIVVNVEQSLSFKFLPGGERINLRANWNSPNPQLAGDIKFRFEGFKFSIKLTCSNYINAIPPSFSTYMNTCAITNSESAATPIFIYINMPNIKASDGSVTLNHLLLANRKLYFESSSRLETSGTGYVRIISTPEETRKMLNYPGALYSGTITLLIESSL